MLFCCDLVLTCCGGNLCQVTYTHNKHSFKSTSLTKLLNLICTCMAWHWYTNIRMIPCIKKMKRTEDAHSEANQINYMPLGAWELTNIENKMSTLDSIFLSWQKIASIWICAPINHTFWNQLNRSKYKRKSSEVFGSKVKLPQSHTPCKERKNFFSLKFIWSVWTL